jgi:carbon monoxide dehydrogenase subunit G
MDTGKKKVMIEIHKSEEVAAPVEKVWRVVGDLENEQKYWPVLRNVKILQKKDEFTLDREATIQRGPLGEAKSFQTLSIDPAQKVSTLTMTKGPLLGSRKITLSSIDDGKKTRLDASWQFEIKGIPGFAQGFVKDNISEVTEKALATIAEEAKASK